MLEKLVARVNELVNENQDERRLAESAGERQSGCYMYKTYLDIKPVFHSELNFTDRRY